MKGLSEANLKITTLRAKLIVDCLKAKVICTRLAAKSGCKKQAASRFPPPFLVLGVWDEVCLCVRVCICLRHVQDGKEPFLRLKGKVRCGKIKGKNKKNQKTCKAGEV